MTICHLAKEWRMLPSEVADMNEADFYMMVGYEGILADNANRQ